jgi:hypothetical protein
MYGYSIRQSWWQRLKGRFTGKYEITVDKLKDHKFHQTYILNSVYHDKFDLQITYIQTGLRQIR